MLIYLFYFVPLTVSTLWSHLLFQQGWFSFFASYGRTTSLFSYNESRRKQDLDNNTSLTHFSSLAVLLLVFSLSVQTALKTQLYFQLSSTTETSQVRPKTVKDVAVRLSTWKSFSVTLSLSSLTLAGTFLGVRFAKGSNVRWKRREEREECCCCSFFELSLTAN